MCNKLVSVIVVAYNSSDYITETLESISGQTWDALELIITDDCSKDDTVEICNKWLNNNRQRFTSTKIITSEKNTGVTANANRGLYAVGGEWIKLLGADDTLYPDCITANMIWISAHNDVKALFSQIEIYKNTFDPENLLKTIPEIPLNKKDILATGRSAASQYKMLLVCDRLNFSPSVFLCRETLLSLGGLDERFAMLEDYPLWLNFTKSGHRLNFMDKVTVRYRQHSAAINNTGIDYLVNPNYFKTENFRRVYTYPYLPADVRLYQRFTWCASQIFRNPRLNRNKRLNKIFHDIMTVYINPFKYFIWLKKRLCRNIKNYEFYM